METNYKITVPKPCHEDWAQMTPDETGRFCNSCVKSVVDFTNMKALEIQEYFIKNQGKSVCGRFRNKQLDSVIIQISRDTLFSQVQFHKIFFLALLINMPGILSCQTLNGDNKKIDKVEVINSSSNKSNFQGKVKTDRFVKDNTTMTPERKAKIEALKKKREALVKQRAASKKTVSCPTGTTVGDVDPVVNGVVAIEPKNPIPKVVDKNFIYPASIVQVEPTFPGGISNFYAYFNSNFKVPEESKDITGRLFFSCVVSADGSLTAIKISRGINKAIDAEALRVLNACPKWIPGEQDGVKVKVAYALPIKITAQ